MPAVYISENVFLIICIILSILIITVLVLGVRLYLIKKTAKEIKNGIEERIIEDTNTLIDVSTYDKDMRNLAICVNKQLQTLNKRRQVYEQGDSELKQAITNISHDLRTPLTAICGYMELLKQEDLSENALQYAEIVENRAKAMKKLTEELFGYSLVIGKEKELELKLVVLNDVLEESLAAFYAVLKDKGIEPKIEITEKKVVRIADRTALSRIFANLLNNAVKYSDGDLEVTLSENGEIVFLNSAKGLDEIEVGRLFERFYTVEAARKSTGLGLAIAKALAEDMGGEMGANYVAGRVRVWVRFIGN